MSTVATVVSARMASTRLPGKALLHLGGVPLVQFLLERLNGTKLGGPVLFATTERGDDDILAARVAVMGVPVFRGADVDVAGRYLAVARKFGLDWIVRVTGDCPFVDAQSLDHCLSQWDKCEKEKTDLFSTKGIFPVGIDFELFSTATLDTEWPKMSAEEKEHLTLRFYRPELGFALKQFSPPTSWPTVCSSYTVDTAEDYERALARVERLGTRQFPVQDLLELPDA